MTDDDRDQARVSLIPGTGLVIRKPGILCVLGAGSAALADDVIALSGTPGHALTRAVATLVDDSGLDDVDIAFAAPGDAGIMVYLRGDVFGELDGRRVAPEGGRPFEQSVQWPFMGLGLFVGDAVADPIGEERFALVDGMVPAAGARLHSPEVSGATAFYNAAIERVKRELAEYRKSKGQSAPADDDAPSTAAMPEMPVTEIVEKPTPGRMPESTPQQAIRPFVSSSLRSDPETPAARPALDKARPPARAPLPPVDRPAGRPAPRPRPPVSNPAQPRPPAPSRPPLAKPDTLIPRPVSAVPTPKPKPQVLGVRCVNGHLNHPAGWICGACGIRMEQQTNIPVMGERPALGWLLLDTGEVFSLDADIVIGRVASSRPEGLQPGEPKTIALVDDTDTISRRHLEIRLVDWDVFVVDLGSINGTYVVDRGIGAVEMQVPPKQPRRLAPGARIRLGNRVLTFESPHARI